MSQHTATHGNDGMMEEVVLPEHLLPLETVLAPGVSALDLCIVLAKIFRVQHTEVALLRLEKGLLRFIFPEHLRTTGAIPLSSKAVAAHTALSKKAEIFNNFAKVKHASIFETIKPEASSSSDQPAAPAPIQKLMSVPIMDRDAKVVGVIQISRKGLDSKYATDFSREDLHDLEIVAGLLATAPALLES
jgi:GAF domain-containing protein